MSGRARVDGKLFAPWRFCVVLGVLLAPGTAWAQSCTYQDDSCVEGDPGCVCSCGYDESTCSDYCLCKLAAPVTKISPKGTVCRIPANTCDMPEKCDGVSATCPSDAYYGCKPLPYSSQVDCSCRVFTLVSPPGGATGVNPAPLLDWTDAPGAARYRVDLVASGASWSTPAYTQAVTASTVAMPSGVLSAGVTYAWRVTALSGAGAVLASTDAVFSTFALLAPADGGDISSTPTLTWTAAPTAASFRLTISASGGTAPVVDVVLPAGATSFTVPGGRLVENSSYTWQVTGFDANGVALVSAGPRTANTMCYQCWTEYDEVSCQDQTVCGLAPRSWGTCRDVPGPFALKVPTLGAIVTTLAPTLDWEDAARSTGYTVWVTGYSPAGAYVTRSWSVTASQFTVPTGVLVAGQTYQWSVSTLGDQPRAASNGVFRFQVAPATCDGASNAVTVFTYDAQGNVLTSQRCK